MGGVELPPVIGHLGGRELMVKPAQQGRFFVDVEMNYAYRYMPLL